MNMLHILFCLAAFLGSCAAEDFGARVRMEADVTKFSAPNWERIERADASAIVSPIFALRHHKEKKQQMDQLVLERSTPGTTTYGQWLSQDQLKELIGPSDAVVSTIKDYLAYNGVLNATSNVYRDIIKTTMTVATAEKMLGTSFYVFKSLLDPRVTLIRIGEPYSLPSDVAKLVYIVDDILRLPKIRQALKKPFGPASNLRASRDQRSLIDSEFDSCGTVCSGFTTPAVLESAYKYSSLATYTNGNSISVAEFQGQYYDETDITAFDSQCDADAAVDSAVGNNVPAVCTELGGCIEALLDIQYAGAVSAPIPLIVWYQTEYSLLTWITAVLDSSDPPLVHSVSYGNDEAQQTSTDYMYSVDAQFEKAASLGLTIFFASGDQGVWGREGQDGDGFHPDFPASSPYITSVGGTNFVTESSIGEEEVWSCGGGGFSDTFEQPSWQTEAVAAYLASASATLPSSSMYNSSGRAYPDVSALGGGTNPYCVAYRGGSFGGVYGTSASCPVVAGIFAMLNDIRLASGKSSLGWVNPFIYSTASSCFNDVTQGQNNCIAGTTGFSATSGWDPASGWGTPDYGCLASVVASL